MERVGGLDAYGADIALCPAPVIDCVIGLHARNDAELREARDVLGPQVLSMLDAKTPVARTVAAGDTLEDVEELFVGTIPDGMDNDVQSGRVRTRDPRFKIFFGVDEKASIRGLVIERSVKRRSVRSE